MEFLKNLEYICTVNKASNKWIWTYFDKNDKFFRLEYFQDKWYLYDKDKYDIILDINEFIDKVKDDIIYTNDIVYNNEIWKQQISNIIGNPTFHTKYVSGWNIKNSKIQLKISVENFKSINDKTIKIQYLNTKDEYMSGKQVLTFVKKHKESIIRDELVEKVNNLDINNNENNNEINANDSDDKISKEKLDRIKRVLYISLPKHRRIKYQSCLPYNEDKQRLEQHMKINLDL